MWRGMVSTAVWVLRLVTVRRVESARAAAIGWVGLRRPPPPALPAGHRWRIQSWRMLSRFQRRSLASFGVQLVRAPAVPAMQLAGVPA
jgi:hypothetical protein